MNIINLLFIIILVYIVRVCFFLVYYERRNNISSKLEDHLVIGNLFGTRRITRIGHYFRKTNIGNNKK